MPVQGTALCPDVDPTEIPTRPLKTIGLFKIRAALPGAITEAGRRAITLNEYARAGGVQIDLKESDNNQPHVTTLSDFTRPRDRGYVKVITDKEKLAVKCFFATKDGRRTRKRQDEEFHQVAAVRALTKHKDDTGRQIYKAAANNDSTPAWQDYEVQNHIQYIRAGQDNLLKLYGFAQWYQDNDPQNGMLLLYHEYCNAGTLLDYTAQCYRRRLPASEEFIVDHVGFQVLSAVNWLHNQIGEGQAVRPRFLHRNIRPENIFFQDAGKLVWPTIKLGGLDMLTPFFTDQDLEVRGHIKRPWDPPEFPKLSRATDVWMLGASLYSALCLGIYPPEDGIGKPEPLSGEQLFSPRTTRILSGMLASDPEERSSVQEIRDSLTQDNEKYQVSMRRDAWRPFEVHNESLLCNPAAMIDNFVTTLQDLVVQYLQGIYDLASQSKFDITKKRALLPTFRALMLAVEETFQTWLDAMNGQPKTIQKFQQDAVDLIINIRKRLELHGDDLWYLTRARHLMIQPLRRGRFMGGSGRTTEIVTIKTNSFINYIQPLVEDTFWRIGRLWKTPVLNAFPLEELLDLTESDIDTGSKQYATLADQSVSDPKTGETPSLQEIAEALQFWLFEQFYQGFAEIVRSTKDPKEKGSIGLRTDNFIKSLIPSWNKDILQGPATSEWNKICKREFRTQWKHALQCVRDILSPLPASLDVEIYLMVEAFVKTVVPISTRYLEVRLTNANSGSFDHVGRVLEEISLKWKPGSELYPDIDGASLIEDIPVRTPTLAPRSFSSADTRAKKNAVRQVLEQSAHEWWDELKALQKDNHQALNNAMDQEPNIDYPGWLSKRCGEVAEVVTADLNDVMPQNPVYMGFGQTIISDAASSALYGLLKRDPFGSPGMHKDSILDYITTILWPYLLALDAVVDDKKDFLKTLLKLCEDKVRQIDRLAFDHHEIRELNRYVAAFEEPLTELLKEFYSKIGYDTEVDASDRSIHVRRAKQIRSLFRQRLDDWLEVIKAGAPEVIQAESEDFREEVARFFDRDWALKIETYVSYLRKKLDTPRSRPAVLPSAGLPEPTSSGRRIKLNVGPKPGSVPNGVAQDPANQGTPTPIPGARRPTDKHASVAAATSQPTGRTQGAPRPQLGPLKQSSKPHSDPRLPSRQLPGEAANSASVRQPAVEEQVGQPDDDSDDNTSFGWSDDGEVFVIPPQEPPRPPSRAPAPSMPPRSERSHRSETRSQNVQNLKPQPKQLPPKKPAKNQSDDTRRLMITLKAPKTAMDVVRRRAEAAEANAQLDWPIDSQESHDAFVRAEIYRASSLPVLGLAQGWKAQRKYTNVPALINSGQSRIIIVSMAGRKVDTRSFTQASRRSRSRSLSGTQPARSPRSQPRQLPGDVIDIPSDGDDGKPDGDEAPVKIKREIKSESVSPRSSFWATKRRSVEASEQPNKKIKTEQVDLTDGPASIGGILNAASDMTGATGLMQSIKEGAKRITRTLSRSPTEAQPQTSQHRPGSRSRSRSPWGSRGLPIALDGASDEEDSEIASDDSFYGDLHYHAETVAEAQALLNSQRERKKHERAALAEWTRPALDGTLDGTSIGMKRHREANEESFDQRAKRLKAEIVSGSRTIERRGILKQPSLPKSESTNVRHTVSPRVDFALQLDGHSSPTREDRPSPNRRPAQLNLASPPPRSLTPSNDLADYEHHVSHRKIPGLKVKHEGMFTHIPGTGGFKFRRLTADELNSLDPLSDDEQFEHEDERYAEMATAAAANPNHGNAPSSRISPLRRGSLSPGLNRYRGRRNSRVAPVEMENMVRTLAGIQDQAAAIKKNLRDAEKKDAEVGRRMRLWLAELEQEDQRINDQLREWGARIEAEHVERVALLEDYQDEDEDDEEDDDDDEDDDEDDEEESDEEDDEEQQEEETLQGRSLGYDGAADEYLEHQRLKKNFYRDLWRTM